jgi:glycosyltransferase involved in cell wall biosynthesis
MVPLISVVIPTAGRPQYLRRAIDSALAGIEAKDIEVIVVPNGPDDSWQETLRPYRDNYSVHIIPVREANANIARNAGLAKARGDIIRFLDDDDYLFPESAIKQYELINSSGADVVSGSVKVVDENGSLLYVWSQPEIDDLCAGALGPLRNCLPTAHVYSQSSLRTARWNPATIVRQDVEWLLDLCASAELRWNRIEDAVGIWQNHSAKRISSGMHLNEICKITVPMVLRTYERLKTENRLTDSRRKAVAQGLWGFTHRAFFFEPLYWTKIARIAQKIHPKVRPIQAMYNSPVTKYLNPLFMQWLLFPKRRIFHRLGQIRRMVRSFVKL